MRRANWQVFAFFAAVVSVSIAGTFGASAEEPLEARGIVQPNAKALIATELVARVAAMPLDAGDRFKRGDLLVSFDCVRYEQELAVAQAELVAEQHGHDANLQMRRHRAVGTSDVAISQAKVARAMAQVEALKSRTAQCAIRAPFDGRVVERRIEPHEMPQANTPLMKIVDDTRFDIDMIVPSRWLRWLEVGQALVFQLDETGARYGAQLAKLGAEVDAVSQTIRVRAVFIEKPRNVLSGMSGTASFTRPQG